VTQVPVLGLLLLAAVLTAPWWIKRVRPGAAETPVRVVGRTAISRNAVVAVVHVGDRRLLVGAAEHGVSILTDLGTEPGADLDAVAEPAVAPLHGRRTDAAPPTTELDDLALLRDVPTLSGPRIGPMDRLRAMTVRTAPVGRPIRAALRR
jgi:flagellar biogenesis protein FliO